MAQLDYVRDLQIVTVLIEHPVSTQGMSYIVCPSGPTWEVRRQRGLPMVRIDFLHFVEKGVLSTVQSMIAEGRVRPIEFGQALPAAISNDRLVLAVWLLEHGGACMEDIYYCEPCLSEVTLLTILQTTYGLSG